MSTTPWGDHTQLSSFPGSFSYFPATVRVRHSTREKLIRHSSPGLGTPFPDRPTNALQGKASSTVQPLSGLPGLFRLPRTRTAAFKPGISQLLSALPCSRYGLGKNRSQ